jgi:hypothetical protein
MEGVGSLVGAPDLCCSSLLCALLSERCQCQCQCRRVGYGALGQQVAYIARASYMTKTDGVCLSCCPSASTPAVARLLVRYWQGSAAVGSPSSVRTGTRDAGSFGGEIEQRCTDRQQKPDARGRSRLSGRRTRVHGSKERSAERLPGRKRTKHAKRALDVDHGQ